MFVYNLKLSLTSLKRNPFLTTLMVLAVALGIGLSMAITNIYYMMSSDPIPEKSDDLYYVRLDSWDPVKPYREPDIPPYQLTYRDAIFLSQSDIPKRQVAMFKTGFVLQPEDESVLPFQTVARASGSDFFTLFNVPFLYGGPWDTNADEYAEQVVVLSRETNDKVFGGENSVGKLIKLDKYYFKVVGVMDSWEPAVKYYDISNGQFDEPEDVFLPFSLTPSLELASWGNNNGWKGEKISSFEDKLNSEMVWIQFWAELTNEDMVETYKSYLDSYALEQKELGRFQRPLNNRVTPVMDWLLERKVVGEETQVLLALAFMFLAVCLLNVVGLILAKFSGKSAEISIRRALGADRKTLFAQHLLESGLVGLLGGILGLLLVMLGLVGISTLIPDISKMTEINTSMILFTVALSIVATMLAGVYPTWRICQIQPAYYLKTQ